MTEEVNKFLGLVAVIQRYATEEELEAKDVVIACEIAKGAIVSGILEVILK